MMTQEEYDQVLKLRSQGLTIKETAQRLGYHPATISKWIRAGGPPAARVQPGVDPIFHQGWSARVAALLAAEPDIAGRRVHKILKTEGFGGSYASAVRHLRTVRGRQAQGVTRTESPEKADPGVDPTG